MRPKPIQLSERAARHAKDAAGSHYVVLTRGAKPVMYRLPASIYDEEDIGYMTDPEFWKMIAERRKGKGGIPLERVKRNWQNESGRRSGPARRRRRGLSEIVQPLNHNG
jgi:hypothetical protein